MTVMRGAVQREAVPEIVTAVVLKPSMSWRRPILTCKPKSSAAADWRERTESARAFLADVKSSTAS